MEQKPKIVILKESLAQSLISDTATLGMILLCVYVSQGSKWWTLVTGYMFLFFVVCRAAAALKSDQCLRFYNINDLRKWVDEQEAK